MGNCLKTQLKEVVNNDNLKVLNTLWGVKTGTGNKTFNLSTSGTDVNVKIYDADKVFVRELNTNGSSVTLGENEQYFSINNKYLLNRFISSDAVTIDLKDLCYCNIDYLSYSGSGNYTFSILDTYRWTNITFFTISGNDKGNFSLTGTTEQIANHPNAANITTVNIIESNVTGSLDDFVNMDSLAELDVRYTSGITKKRSIINVLTQKMGDNFKYNGTIIEDV